MSYRIKRPNRFEFALKLVRDRYYYNLTVAALLQGEKTDKFFFIKPAVDDDYKTVIETLLVNPNGSPPTSSQIIGSLIYLYRYTKTVPENLGKALMFWAKTGTDCNIDLIWNEFLCDVLRFSTTTFASMNKCQIKFYD